MGPTPAQGGQSSRPAPRIKPEAEEIARKSRGSMDTLLNVDNNVKSRYHSARPVARCPSETAQKMNDKARGSMDNFIGTSAEFRPMKVANKHPARAVRSEAATVSQNNKGNAMKNLIDKYGNADQSSRPVARIKPEAEAIVQGHQGKALAGLFHDYGKHPRSSRMTKTRPEGEEYAERSVESKGLAKLLSMEQTARSARTARSETDGACAWGGRPISRQDNHNKRNVSTWW